jgi:glycosyltransferase involved in cell wall biosynthesis
MSLKSKKIMFLAPRIHPNQLDLLNNLNQSCNLIFMSVKNPENNKYSIKSYEKHISSSILNRLNFFKDFPIYSTYFVPNIFRFIKKILSFSPDSIIVRNSSPNICVAILFILKPFLRFNLIYYSQTPIFKKKISKSFYKDIILSFFDKRISPVLCKPYLINYKEKYSKENIKYIPFAKNLSITTPRVVANPITVLCVGKYEKRKNLEIVINSVIELNKQGNTVFLSVIGIADTQERIIFRNNLIKKFDYNFIKFKSNIPHQNMKEHYVNSDVFILISENETASVSQLEAMSYGLPVIISKDNGTASYCDGCGFIINPTKNEIKNSIIKLIKDDLFYEKLSLNAIEKVGQYHDVKSISNNFISL